MKSDTNSATPSNWPVNILAAMMFLTPAAGVPNEYMLQDTLKSAIGAFGVLASAAVFFWQSSLRIDTWQWSHILWLPLFLTCYALGTVIWGDPYLAAVEAIRWLLVGLLIWLTLNIAKNKSFSRLLWAAHWGATAASAWVALQFWFDLRLFPQAAAPASTFINRNFFSEYVVCIIPISVYLVFSLKSIRYIVTAAISLALEVIAILMTGTRSALVVMAIYLPLLLFTGLYFRTKLAIHNWSGLKRIAFIGTFITALVTMGNVPSDTVEIGVGRTPLNIGSARVESLEGVTKNSDSSFSMRLEMWRATARMILAQPLAGVGAGAWEVKVPLYQRLETGEELDAYAHNEYLQMLAEYGALVGGLVLAFAAASLVLSSLKIWSSMKDPAAAFMVLSMAGLALVACVGFPLHLAPCSALLGILTGYLAQNTSEQNIARISKKVGKVCLAISLIALLLWSVLTITAAYVESHFASADALLMQALNHPDVKGPSISSAKQHLTKTLKVHPKYTKLLKPIVAELVELGEWGTAQHVMEILAQARPYAPDLWFSLAILRAKNGDFHGAEEALAKLDVLQPGALRNEKVRIDLLLRQNQFELADIALKRLVSTWPADLSPDPALTAFAEHISQRLQQKTPR